MRKPITAFALLLSICVVVRAQDANKPPAMGILNGYAKALAKPILTSKEIAACASGQVTVEIQIAENGKVISASAVSGDMTLRRASVQAARRATFNPIVHGPPIKLRGYLVYNFELPSKCPLAKERVIWLCNINAKVVNIPLPEYPPTARAVRAQGKVDVAIEIDKNGKVTSARATAGHPFLRAASEKAALNAVFEPAVLSDNRQVKATGTITYNFFL